jgi:hypothetical protein
MDYIFFAFSAMCVGFTVLLAILLASRLDRQPGLLHLGLAAAAAFAFYYFDVSVFSRQLVSYYLANLLPQVAVLLGLALYLLRRENS